MSLETTTWEAPKLSVLLKGKPGAAKTHTALGFPGPILYLYSDPNLETARRICNERKDVAAIRIADWKNYYTDIRALFKDRRLLEVNGESVKTIVLDTWSFSVRRSPRIYRVPKGRCRCRTGGSYSPGRRRHSSSSSP